MVAPSPPAAVVAPVLTWLGEFTRPAAAVYPALSDSAKFGSLSALALDVASGQWVGAIDDREGTRVAWLTIDFAGGRLQVTPNRMMALIHNTRQRMPAILEPSRHAAWLAGDADEAFACLTPYADELMIARPVSTRVNSPKSNDPGLVDEISRA